MAAIQHPVIVLPGITGTTLHDGYPLKTDDLWTLILNKEYERLALHPDDLRYENVEPAQVYAGRLFGAIYNDLTAALRHELTRQADKPTPVFAFPYDWRHDLRATARHLADFVEEVVARTKLLRHYRGYETVEKVDFVGHSMGGLIIAEYLHEFGEQKRVGKVVTVATPFEGSIEAIVKIATGTGGLTPVRSAERERESARITPAVYQLLPTYSGAVFDQHQNSVDILDDDVWQSSVLQSLGEYVRLHSVNTLARDRMNRAGEILSEMLSGTNSIRNHTRDLSTAMAGAGLEEDAWLAIVGLGERTRQRIQVDVDVRKRHTFHLDDADLETHATDEGDGTVPLAGALPPHLDRARVVGITKRELGFWEWRDRVLTEVGGLHSLFPQINLVQRLIVKHLYPGFRGPVKGRALPNVPHWNPPIKGLKQIR